jgi:flagellar hook assembly protein FlgD
VSIPGLSFSLHQNYPNPFNPVTVIPFDLGAPETVWLEIYDVSGALVRSLIRGRHMGPGSIFERWDGTNSTGERVSSGIYYCRLRAGKNEETRTMIVLR